MKKLNKNFVVCLSSLMIVGASFALLKTKPKEVIENVSNSQDKIVGLNQKEIKFRNNGDSFELEATVNADATVKGVRFTIDREDCISLTRVSQNKVRLTRLKEFKGIATITATSEDIYSTFKEECYVRCYNEFIGFGDLSSKFNIENNTRYFSDVDYIYLSKNYTTHVEMTVFTRFGEADDPYEDGTYSKVEEQDLSIIEQKLTDLLAPLKISNFAQKENTYCDENIIYFDLEYNDAFLNEQKSVVKRIEVDEHYLDITIEKYIAVTSLNFSNNEIIVI